MWAIHRLLALTPLCTLLDVNEIRSLTLELMLAFYDTDKGAGPVIFWGPRCT